MTNDIHKWLKEKSVITTASGLTYDVVKFKEAADLISFLKSECDYLKSERDYWKKAYEESNAARVPTNVDL